MPVEANLTERQRKIYEFIRSKILGRGLPPTIREIGNAFGIDSPNGVMCHLRALEKKGLIHRDNKSARAIQLTDYASQQRSHTKAATFPLLGSVAAGQPLDAVEQQEVLDLGELFAGEDRFVLRVKGNSMIENHIEDGDYVLIKRQETANNGETVVAKVDNEVTLKKFYRRKDHVELQPANGTMAPIIVDATKNVEVLGVLVGVFRKC
jgi:repressor LexA